VALPCVVSGKCQGYFYIADCVRILYTDIWPLWME